MRQFFSPVSIKMQEGRVELKDDMEDSQQVTTLGLEFDLKIFSPHNCLPVNWAGNCAGLLMVAT